MRIHSRVEPAIFPRRVLTPREYQVAELVSRGFSNREIADELIISPATVARHVASTFAKLEISSRSQLAFGVAAERAMTRSAPQWEESRIRDVRATLPSEQINSLLSYASKPDPLAAKSLSELEDHLRFLWAWTGRPSSRKLAERSCGAFSHATISKIIYDKPGKPALRLEYVLGFVRACGGDEVEKQLWANAWRAVTIDWRASSTDHSS